MKIRSFFVFILACVVSHAVEVGSVAPDFELKSHEGKTVKLSDFKGKIVVLEWTNFECPFVKAHYDPKAMQHLQEQITAKGGVWLQIVSSAPGKQGYISSAEEAKKLYEAQKMKSTALLLDSTGSTGKAYGAKKTPQMFIIDKDGKIAYSGAIDSNPRPEFSPSAQNYVSKAFEELVNNKPVSVPYIKSYGCGVKY